MATLAATALFATLLGFAAVPGTWTRVEGGDWVPDAHAMAALKDSLKSEFDRNAAINEKRNHVQVPAWSENSFQFQGVERQGKRVINVNAYCWLPEPTLNLAKQWVAIVDGGPCFFHTNYDLETHSFTNFRFNGVA